MSQSPEAAMQSMIDNLATKTGKPLAEWVKLVKKSALQKHGEIVAMLKKDHGLGHGYANLVAHQALGSDSLSVAKGGVDLVAEQYSGAKAALHGLIRQVRDSGLPLISVQEVGRPHTNPDHQRSQS